MRFIKQVTEVKKGENTLTTHNSMELTTHEQKRTMETGDLAMFVVDALCVISGPQ